MKKWAVFFIIIMLIMLTSCHNTQNFDYSKYPYYIEDTDSILNEGFSVETMMIPYWKGNVIYNETVLMLDNNEYIGGKLLISPVKIISVRDDTLEIEYKQGKDYTIQGNKIIRMENSSIPYITQDNLKGINVSEGYRQVSTIANVLTDYVMWGELMYTESPLIYGHYVNVSYVYDLKEIDSDLNIFSGYSDLNLKNIISKLQNKQNINLTVIGDSISEGCSSSLKFNHKPFLPPYAEQVKTGLESYYNIDVNLTNISKGGEKSAWAAQGVQINRIIDTNPDLLIIGFGMNDATANVIASKFYNNIESIIYNVKDACPDCSFIILHSYPPNSMYALYDKFYDYMERLQNIVSDNTAIVDMFKVGEYILKTKRYQDISANNVNHPNDFFMRIYAMNILSALIDY